MTYRKENQIPRNHRQNHRLLNWDKPQQWSSSFSGKSLGSFVWFYHGIWSSVFKDLESSSNLLKQNSKNGEYKGSILTLRTFGRLQLKVDTGQKACDAIYVLRKVRVRTYFEGTEVGRGMVTDQGWVSGDSTRLPPIWPGGSTVDSALYVGWVCFALYSVQVFAQLLSGFSFIRN